MALEFEVRKPNQKQAEEVRRLLKKEGINIMINEIMSLRCLVAVDREGEVISFALYIKQNEASVFHFRSIGRKKKNRIKDGFFSKIFNRQMWMTEKKVPQAVFFQESHYMFPG